MAEPIKLTPFNGTFGLPPASYVSNDMIVNSMPVMQITPGQPNLIVGQQLFKVTPDLNRYNKLLANHGFATSHPIKLAFIADNFPTDTFSNEYGETFLQRFTDVASRGLAEIAQMTGQTTAVGGLRDIGTLFSDLGEGVGGITGQILGTAGRGATGAATSLENLQNILRTSETRGNQFLGNALQTISKMVGGHRVDFPQIWRNSGFTPSYTATIRLYNPNPGNQKSTRYHIIGPLAVILCLAMPRTDNGTSYYFPFFHKIQSKGIYTLDPAMITNVTVIKGGDQQQIGFTQRMGVVDVRIDFGSLYTTIVAEEEGVTKARRPTLNNYLESMLQNDTSLYTKRNNMNTRARRIAGVLTEDEPVVVVSEQQRILESKSRAASYRKPLTITDVVETTRVPTSIREKENNLIADSPSDFIDVNV